jgi:thiol-disulfide isomerase/thioredoxin
MPSTVKKVFKALDLYRYQRLFEEDCYTHSWHSYLFTFVLVFTIVFLVAGEIVGHLKPIYTQDLFVDEILDNQKMAVDFDVLFMTVPCHFIDITVSDITGNMEHNISKHIVRTRLDHKGRVLGDQDEDAMIDQAEHKEVLVKENDEYESLLQSDFQHDGHVEELHTRNGLETFIKAHKKPRELVFIDFYAPWCIWCQRLEPVFAKLGQEVGSKGPIFVGRIDCTKDENIDACQSQHVHSFPTMLFFRHGEEHPFESYQGERTVAAMKKRAVEIARGDPQSAADQKKNRATQSGWCTWAACWH